MKCTGLILASALLLGGCTMFQSAPPPTTEGYVTAPSLQHAHALLREGCAEEAVAELDAILADVDGRDRLVAALLKAEARLQQGRADEALTLADSVLEARPGDVAANEIAGKALLKMGRYQEADNHFTVALSAAAPESADHRRLSDLTNITRGLVAWSDADPELARSYWKSVWHPTMRQRVDEALRSEARTARATTTR